MYLYFIENVSRNNFKMYRKTISDTFFLKKVSVSVSDTFWKVSLNILPGTNKIFQDKLESSDADAKLFYPLKFQH